MVVGGGGNEEAVTGRTGWTQAQRRQGAGVSGDTDDGGKTVTVGGPDPRLRET